MDIFRFQFMLVYHRRGLLWQLVLVGALPFTKVAPLVNQICDLLKLAVAGSGYILAISRLYPVYITGPFFIRPAFAFLS